MPVVWHNEKSVSVLLVLILKKKVHSKSQLGLSQSHLLETWKCSVINIYFIHEEGNEPEQLEILSQGITVLKASTH